MERSRGRGTVGSGALLTAHTIFYVADMNKVPSCATLQGGEDETSIMDLSERARWILVQERPQAGDMSPY